MDASKDGDLTPPSACGRLWAVNEIKMHEGKDGVVGKGALMRPTSDGVCDSVRALLLAQPLNPYIPLEFTVDNSWRMKVASPVTP